MDHIFAKIKGHVKKLHFKIISDHTLFDTIQIDLDACVVYDPDHNLDEDAWFKVEQFTKQPFCSLDFIKADFDSKDYEDLQKAQFSKIAYIFSTQGDDFYFQKISPSLFICKKFIAFGEAAKIEENENRLVVNTKPDAVYFKNSDTLVFRNIATISSIFNGIDQLFKEATKEEVSQFLKLPFISLINDYNVDSVSKPNRKRIALAMETLAKMSDQDRTDIFAYINGYCSDTLNFDAATGNINISKDNDLKLLIYAIEQRFYTTLIGHEKRLANSIQAVN
ncbi:ATP F0F1 synthase synthase [Iodobacter ciconiae]|uniref:ATP F0F1 synthase synthase n=1 Tax=Iodobacter ciconiae TaxID=2496266 RepID=A0A3S8ZTA3_9NEIS|nr:ATP F0F1 synthase synthase [Iodobacter ciconiae]AZN36740.1 ATP F0F1 synthase synthase [Iodobacter ciconiae]